MKKLIQIVIPFLIINYSFLINNCVIAQETGFPFIRNYAPKEYSGSAQVWTCLQNKAGIMYFGVEDGIIEYDGVTWRKIYTENKGAVRSMAMDEKGRIYIASSGSFGFLDKDEKNKTVYKSLNHLINDSTLKIGIVWSVKYTQNNIYFQLRNAIIQYNPSTEKIIVFKPDNAGRFWGDFVIQDQYFIRLGYKGLLKIENDTIMEAPNSLFFNDQNSFRIGININNDNIFIPTYNNGLFLYQPLSNSLPVKFNISNDNFLKSNNVTSSIFYLNRYFILSSAKKGCVLFDTNGNILQKYNEENLLQVNEIYDLKNDSSQNIWLGTSNGISKTELGLDLSFWNKYAGLKGIVYGLIRFEGTLYIATSSSLYYLENDTVKEIENVPVGQNWCFTTYCPADRKENILLAGTVSGIYQILGKRAIGLRIFKGGHAFTIYKSVKDKSRIFSTEIANLISMHYQNGKWIDDGAIKGIKEEIRGMIEDENNDLWLGTYSNGVVRITFGDSIQKPKKIKYYKESSGLPSLRYVYPFRVRGNILFGTEFGFYIYNPSNDRFEPYCEISKMFCCQPRDVEQIIETPDKNIWIIPASNENADIGYLKPDEKGNYSWIYKPFRRLPQMEINCFLRDTTGIVWIGGSEGLFRYDFKKDTKDYNQNFNCLIRKVKIGGDRVLSYGSTQNQTDLESTVDLKFKFNTLKFEFAAPYFDKEEKMLYSFMLEGFENEWSKWSRQTEKEYTNLHEGVYKFKAKAKNIYDAESETGTYQIHILPPYYRTWWAFAIYIILTVLFLLIILKFYTRRLVAQKKYLELVVKERTAEVVQQKEEISQTLEIVSQQKEEITAQKNIIEKKNRNITDSIAYASLIQKAILPRSEILTAHFPDNFILFKPRDIVSGDFYFIKQLNHILLLAVADCTGHGVPGAFMSMLGSSLLNEILRKKEIETPAEILNQLRDYVKLTLQQTGERGEQQDGMDIALCAINLDTMQLQFAGANSPLWLIRNQNPTVLEEYNGDNQPIGIFIHEKPFTNFIVQLEKDDQIYVFSDGYESQFGGGKGKTMQPKRFQEIILLSAKEPMHVQKDILLQKFDDWRGTYEQIDDVLVIGIKFSY